MTIAPAPVSDEADLPAIFDLAVDRHLVDGVVSWWRDAPGSGAPVRPKLRRALRPAEIDALALRRAALRRATEPYGNADKKRLTAAIVRMLGGFPQMAARSDAAMLATAANYLMTVADCPPWAVAKACDMIRAGTAGINRDFCPTEPAFAGVVRPLPLRYAAALARIEAVIEACPPEPAEARTKAAGETVDAILMRFRDPERRVPATAAEREAWLVDKARGALDRMADEAAAADRAAHAARALDDLERRKAARAAADDMLTAEVAGR